jgi:hypothetical protein
MIAILIYWGVSKIFIKAQIPIIKISLPTEKVNGAEPQKTKFFFKI